MPIPALFLSALPALPLPQDADAARLVAVDLAVVAPAAVAELDLDVASHDGVLVPGRINELVVRAADLERLDEAGIPYRVLVGDLEAHYLARLDPGGVADVTGGYGAWLTPAFGQGGMGGYYTFPEIEAVLDQIAAAYPALVAPKVSLGQTIEGREQWMLKVSDNPLVDEAEPEVRFDAMHHSREPQSMQATLWFLLSLLEDYGSDPVATYLVDEREIFFVPCVNPDGYEHNRQTNPGGGGLWRKNRRDNGDGTFGVDLNRNYDAQWGYNNVGSSSSTSSETYRGTAPASEPEVANMQAFIDARDFRTALTSHTYSNLWLYPLSFAPILPANEAEYAEVSALATSVNNYLAGPSATTLYEANGVTDDYDHIVHGTMSWTPEIGSSADGFWPPTSRIVPLAEENVFAFQVTAFAAGAFVRPDLAFDEVGDGDGFAEAGERLEWPRVRNVGLSASGPVAVDLSCSSPFATVATAQDFPGSIPSFTTSVSASPVALDIAPGTPGGTRLDYDLTVTYEGHALVHSGTVTVGELRPYLADAVEVDRGWTAGLASDTATTGLWERGDPVGTFNGSEPSNPEDDATPAPGTQAFVTGNGGGSAGTDDVDDGHTTLLSPVFDLSGVTAARLSYARWYALMSTEDDTFDVHVSNDAGASWTLLEQVASNQNAWTTAAVDLHTLIPFTDAMQLRFVASDEPNNSLVEAAIDELRVDVYDSAPRLHFYGPVQAGGTVQLNVSGPAGARYLLQWSEHPGASTVAGQTGSSAGTWNRLLPGASAPLTGTIPASGLDQRDFPVPSLPGRTLRYRAITRGAGTAGVSNVADLAIP